MAQLTSNTTAFIEAQQYSQFILDNLHDYLLPEGMYRDVTDFGSGTTLNIKTVGTVTLQDAAEDVPLNFTNIDTGTITLAITDYIGDAWKVSDDLREDGSQVDTLMAMRAMESTRALGEHHNRGHELGCQGRPRGQQPRRGIGLVAQQRRLPTACRWRYQRFSHRHRGDYRGPAPSDHDVG
jgi:hypothetical protein